jgi:hypothetical protein
LEIVENVDKSLDDCEKETLDLLLAKAKEFENDDESLDDYEEETLDQILAKAREFENDDSFLNEEAEECENTDSDDLVEEDCAGTLCVKVVPNSWR